MREIFICGMKLWQEMRIRKSFLLGCELVPIWATSKVEKMGVTPGQGPRFAFPRVRLSIFPGRRMSLSSASFMMFLATSNSKSTPAGLNHKENAASHMTRGGVTSGLAAQCHKQELMLRPSLYFLRGHKVAAAASDTTHTHQATGENAFQKPPSNPQLTSLLRLIDLNCITQQCLNFFCKGPGG